MSQAAEKTASVCATCSAQVIELRRGRCWTCYSQWSEQRPVGLGACCVVCDDRRHDNLRLQEVKGRSLALCHLCAAKIAKLEVVPHSVDGLRAALRRDRRQSERRDDEEQDDLIGHERRVLQRRASDQVGLTLLNEDASTWQLGDIDFDIDRGAAELEVGDFDIIEDTMVATLSTATLASGSASGSAAPAPLAAAEAGESAEAATAPAG